MSEKLAVQKIKQKYERLFQDEGITAVSCWTEPNASVRFSEKKFRETAKKNAFILKKQLDEAIDGI